MFGRCSYLCGVIHPIRIAAVGRSFSAGWLLAAVFLLLTAKIQPLAAQTVGVAQVPQTTDTPAPAAASVPPAPNAYPEFVGGDAALMQFLGQTLRYPADAYKEGAQGKVDVSFWIDEKGHPYGFGVVESPHPSLAVEALRALRLMPDWLPGRRNGQIAPQLVHVPVVFRRPTSGQ